MEPILVMFTKPMGKNLRPSTCLVFVLQFFFFFSNFEMKPSLLIQEHGARRFNPCLGKKVPFVATIFGRSVVAETIVFLKGQAGSCR